MKTTKLFSAISFIVIFTCVGSFAHISTTGNPLTRSAKPAVIYQVTVHIPVSFNVCNPSLYLIRITNELGIPVTSAQIFTPGQNKYVFTESGPATGKRIARLFLPENVDNSGCPVELVTPPAVISGPFIPGNTYSFDLFPSIRQSSANDK